MNAKRPTLDPLIHEAARLAIAAALAGRESADFNSLLATTGLTRGNLSTHLARLIAAGYVDETKQFIDRKPNTRYRLNAVGRAAFDDYRAAWRKLTGG